MSLLTVPEAAKRLGFSRQTIYRMIADRQIRKVTVRGVTRIPESEIARISHGPARSARHREAGRKRSDRPALGGPATTQ